MVSLGRRYAPNVKWVWSPNKIVTETKKWYPGNSYVDYIGLTLNTHQNDKITYPTFKDYLTKNKGKALLEGSPYSSKPVIFGEVAIEMKDMTAKKKYLNSMFDFIASNSHYIGFVYLDMTAKSQATGASYYYKISDNATLRSIFSSRSRDLIYNAIYPASIRTIDNDAFLGNMLRNIYIPDGVTTIGEGTFANSGRLETIRVPASVTSIGDNAFTAESGVMIIGTPGSAAESFANANGIRFGVEVP